MSRSTQRAAQVESQRGIIMLEVLISLVLFAVGILGLISLQAKSITMVRDSNYRFQASLITDQLIGAIWADRSATAVGNAEKVQLYAYNSTAANAGCSIYAGPGSCTCPTGTNTTPAITTSYGQNIANWLTQLGQELPGTAGYQQQIIVGASNMVTVVVCWKAPQDANPHMMVETVKVQG